MCSLLRVRPFVSESVAGFTITYQQRGYIIGGTRHKLKCHCYACQIVRRRAREKRLAAHLFNHHCG